MKTEPRIVLVATKIATIQARRSAIHKELETINARVCKLEEECGRLGSEQNDLQRQMDKLSSGATVHS